MTGNVEEQELKDRLSLIESMIAEGRRTTESWAWTFVFWGVAYYVAILWTAVYHWPWAWLVTMAGAWVVCMMIIQKKKKSPPEHRPGTTMGRAIFSIWGWPWASRCRCCCRLWASAAGSTSTYSSRWWLPCWELRTGPRG